MTSASSATEKAVYDALSAAVTGAPVYQDVPENSPLPLVVIGPLVAVGLGIKGDPDRRITLDIITLVTAEEREPLLDLQDQIEATLNDASLSYDGWTIRPWLESTSSALAEDDGTTYVGTSIFTILALRA
jgi:hypothetical protein